MKNYKLTIEYDGTRFNGWQKQGNTKNTIQERFEHVLAEMCGKPIEIHASGRTDAGVHAKGQVANFKCDTAMSCIKIQSYLNRYLPEDVRVISVEEADERFHSRLNAVSKTYRYTFAPEKPDVFIRKYVYVCESKPSPEAMRSAAERLIGTHDFMGFCSLKKTKKSTVRTINQIDIREENGLVIFEINGNGFLYNMVRILAGTLYAIGVGELDETVIDDIFEEKDREKAGATLPACGLSLIEVQYRKE